MGKAWGQPSNEKKMGKLVVLTRPDLLPTSLFNFNKYSFYPTAIRTWNSISLSLIPDSLDELKAIIPSL